MPKQLTAIMNNGRWIMRCPKDGTYLPAWDTGVICPKCHPGILAKAFEQTKDGLLRPVADVELVEKARNQAREKGEEYFPKYPDERHEIERILRFRPNPANMNWIPSETLDDLRRQNINHGDPVE